MKKHKLKTLLAVFLLLQSIITQAQNTELWGMTSHGGDYNSGTIFKTDFEGNNQSVEYTFYKVIGTKPLGKLCLAANGKLYGMTSSGGSYDYGVLFEYDPATNTYVKKLDFDGSTNGKYPRGSLLEAGNGKLYGMTHEGGSNGKGVLFEYDPATNTYVKKLDFDGSATGRFPQGSLIEAGNGKLYGMTNEGGVNDDGVLFEYDPVTNAYAKRLDFDRYATGSYPNGSLLEAGNGKLYGVTSWGGSRDYGVLFEYDPTTDTYTKKLDFNDAIVTGRYPLGSLLEAGNGKLYGMTYKGGVNDLGVLFEYNPTTDTYTKKLDFDGSSTGRYPKGSLLEAGNGKLYGMTLEGGSNGKGVLFEYDPATDTYTKKLDFDGSATGEYPYGSLLEAGNGKLYGMTSEGGVRDWGVLFEYDPVTFTYTKKLDFESSIKGLYPYGSLLEAGNGKLYGMTVYGGVNGYGVLFEYNPVTDTYTKKLDFDGSATGSRPYGSLIEAGNGKLYGMTYKGGVNDDGVLFEYDPATNTYIKKLDFDGSAIGSHPESSLLEAGNGKLYGMTSKGGVNDYGVLFEYDPITNTYTKKLDFDGSATGAMPGGSLLEAGNGKLYGMTYYGGSNTFGVLFEYDPASNIYIKKLNFNGTTGRYPDGSLLEAGNGKLYGMTSQGGVNDNGVLFEYDPATDTYTKKLDFDDPIVTGIYPYGSLIEASNGKLYGMTSLGGVNNDGVLFEYNPNTDIYTKKLDFDGSTTGERPYGSLIEINATNGIVENDFGKQLMVQPNPSNGNFAISFGQVYKNIEVTISDLNGKLVYSNSYKDAETVNISIKQVPAGIYLTHIQSGEKKAVIKLIKE